MSNNTNSVTEIKVRYINGEANGPKAEPLIKEYVFGAAHAPQLLISSFKSSNYIIFGDQRYSCGGSVTTTLTESYNDFSGGTDISIVHEITLYPRNK